MRRRDLEFQIFDSFEAADEYADPQFRAMSPQERVNLLLQMI